MNKNKRNLSASLPTVNAVKDFVNIITKYPFDADLTSGRHTIDAKSIMGIFSLDISKPVSLVIHYTDDESDVVEKFINEADKFIV